MQPNKKKLTENRYYTMLCMTKGNDIFPTEIVEDVCPLPGQTRPFPLLLPHGKVSKALPVARLEMK